MTSILVVDIIHSKQTTDTLVSSVISDCKPVQPSNETYWVWYQRTTQISWLLLVCIGSKGIFLLLYLWTLQFLTKITKNGKFNFFSDNSTLNILLLIKASKVEPFLRFVNRLLGVSRFFVKMNSDNIPWHGAYLILCHMTYPTNSRVSFWLEDNPTLTIT